MPNNLILIVDDEPQNLAILRQILAPSYGLVFARTGSEALAAVEKHAPSLVLLDIQMPDMNGYDVCRAIKANPLTEHIPVIFVTGLGDVGNEAEGFVAGAVDYIVKPVSPAVVKARIATHLSLVRVTRLEQSYRDAIYMLGAAGHYNDNDTGAHIWRMAAYARALAECAGWDKAACEMLELAAPMHDTGKIGIPEAILSKPGKLDADEWLIMKTHSQIGYDILSRSQAPIFRLAAEIALHHHEKWNGTGYPDGLSGEHIPESARIVAVADVFDALSMRRPYKEPWPLEKILETMQSERGQHFSPELIDLLLANLAKFIHIRDMWQAKELASASSQ